MKKVVSIILILVLAVVCIVGCGGDSKKDSDSAGSSDGKGVTLSLMGNSGDIGRDFIDRALKLYEEETGNKLDIQGIPNDNFEQVSSTKFNTGDIPDIFMSFGKETLRKYKPHDNFVDFSDADWVDSLTDVAVQQAEFEGVIWGLPFWEASATGFYYNKPIFEEHDIEVPKTQAEFMEVCQKLKDAGINPLYIGFQDTWPILNQIAMDPIFYDNDGANLEKINKNEITYSDIPEMHSMMEWYKEMADKGYLGDNYTTNTYDYGADAMGNDEYAMIFIWDTWLYMDLDGKYPGKADEYGLMPAFMGTTEEGTIEGPNMSLFLVNKNGDHVEEAIKFVEFMASPECFNHSFEGVNTIAAFKDQTSSVQSPQYTEAEESGLLEKVFRPSSTWGNVIGFTQGDTAKATQDIMLGNSTIEEGLTEIDNIRISIAKAQQTEGFVD